MDQAGGKAALERFEQLALVVDDAAAGSSECIGGPHDQRIAELLRELQALARLRDDRALRNRLADLDHLALEALAIFREFDRFDRRAEQRDAPALQYAAFVEFNRQIQAGLAAQRREERVRAFAFDDRLDGGSGQRLQIDRVGHFRIRHNRRGIRVDKDDPVAFLAQGAARLDAGIVEFGGLTDADRPRTDDEDVAAHGGVCQSARYVQRAPFGVILGGYEAAVCTPSGARGKRSRYHSTVRRRPSCSETTGSYPNAAREALMSASECFKSQTRSPSKRGSPVKPVMRASRSYTSRSVWRSPIATLNMRPATFSAGARAASRLAEMTLSMYVKSRLCVPSP